jgi:hypothetical protein
MRDQITRLSDDSITLSPERRAALEQIAQEVSVQEVAHGSSRALLRPTLRSIILDALLRAESSQAGNELERLATAQGVTAGQPIASDPAPDADTDAFLAALDHAQDGDAS